MVRNRDRHDKPLRSVICVDCGLVWTDPRPSPEDERAFYAHDYRRDYKGVEQPKLKHVHRSGLAAVDRWRRVRELVPKPGMIMDIGAGGGEFLYMGAKLGHCVRGVEPNQGYARYASETLGLPIQAGFYQDVVVDEGSLDLLTLFHVVEHLENPLEAISTCRTWLKPGGSLMVEVPNVEATCQHPSSQFHRGHLYHFNPVNLSQMMRRAGLEPLTPWLSADGGNVAVIGTNPTSGPGGNHPPSSVTNHPAWAIPGNHLRVRRVLDGHTGLNHILKPAPYVRPISKLMTRTREWLGVRGTSDGRELLDRLFDQHLAEWAPDRQST